MTTYPNPNKSMENQIFEHYLRTGLQFTPEEWRAAHRIYERKFNPYHDPDNGRFTFAPGGGVGNASVRANSAGHNPTYPARLKKPNLASSNDPIGDIIAAHMRVSNDPIGDIIEAHMDKTGDKTQTSNKPKSETAPRTAAKPGKSILEKWPIAGASKDSLNKADKPQEGDPRYGSSRTKGIHRGIDIKAPSGTIVRSASVGTVISVAPNPSRSFGYQVLIYHGKGVYTQYAHLQPGSTVVKSGQKVLAGEHIARVGRTGNTPPLGDSHLHFEVRIGSGAPAISGGHTGNPLDYLPK